MESYSFLLVCVWGLVFCAMTLAQPPLPQNTCVAYNRMATAAASTQVSNKIVTKGGPGFESRLEMPSRLVWVPKCDKDGLYVPMQVRMNREKFCVLPKTGEVAFDPFKNKTVSANRLAAPLFCDCFVQRRSVLSGHVRDMVANCDENTGFYKPVQFFPNGMSQCFSPNGTRISTQFVDDGSAGPGGIPSHCKTPALLAGNQTQQAGNQTQLAGNQTQQAGNQIQLAGNQTQQAGNATLTKH